MRCLTGAVLTALLLPGCALIDGLFGAESATTDEICESLLSKLDSCEQPMSEDECGAMFSCLNTSRMESCEGPWRRVVQCAFDDDTACSASPDGSSVPCQAEIESFVTCARERGAEAACFGDEDAGPHPCDPSDPSCGEDPCDTMTCPGGEECVDGTCVRRGTPDSVCSSPSDCDTGLVCASAADLCNSAFMAPVEVCNALDPERRCRVPCGSNAECPEGSRCYLEVPVGADMRRGVCAPGGCNQDSDCPGRPCIDRDNGPGSGFCAEPCDISSCESGAGCGGCTSGSCQSLAPDYADVTAYACLGDGATPYGSSCDGAGHYRCVSGASCVIPGGTSIPTCRSYCSTNADCAPGERCEAAPSPNGGVCVDDESDDCGCGAGETCEDARELCEELAVAGLGIDCSAFPFDQQQCYAQCTVDGAVTCSSGGVCLPFTETSLQGVCVDAPCSEDAQCGLGAGCVHFGGSAGGAGVCVRECDTTCVAGTGCSSCSSLAQCRLLPRAEEQGGASLEMVCAGGGTAVVGASCDPAAPDCGPGLGCFDGGAGFVCAELCGHERLCPGGGCSVIDGLYDDEFNDVTGFCFIPPAPVCGECAAPNVCVNGDDVCVATPTLNPFQGGCPWVDQDGCAVGCTSDAECASGARCAENPFTGERFCLFRECDQVNACEDDRACVAEGSGAFSLCAEPCDPVACAQGTCDCPVERPACTGVPLVGTMDLTFVCAEATSTTLNLGWGCTLGEVGCPAGSLCAINPPDGTPKCLRLCDAGGQCPGASTCATADTGTYWHPGVDVCSWET